MGVALPATRFAHDRAPNQERCEQVRRAQQRNTKISTVVPKKLGTLVGVRVGQDRTVDRIGGDDFILVCATIPEQVLGLCSTCLYV